MESITHELYNQVGELFNDVTGQVIPAPFIKTYSQGETEKEYQISVMLPGVPKEQIEVKLGTSEGIDNKVLKIIAGEKPKPSRPAEEKPDTDRFYFEGAFELPSDASDEIRAKYENGVLMTFIQKKQKGNMDYHEVKID